MQSIPNNSKRKIEFVIQHSQLDFILVYYPPNSQLIMNKYQFHDSGIVDEGLSDETGSIEEDRNTQENPLGK